MKHILLLLLLPFLWAVEGRSQSYDFSAVNADGLTLYYKVLDEDKAEVQMVGELTRNVQRLLLPDTVQAPVGKKYIVTQIEPYVGDAHLEELILPNTLRYFEWQTFLYLSNVKKIVFPASVEQHNGIIFQFAGNPEEIHILLTAPPQNVFAHYAYPAFNIHLAAGPMPAIYVPTDCTHAFKSRVEDWSYNASDNSPIQYQEQLTFSSNGYTSYYLENENFEVPAGCTAYIVTGVTPVREGEGTAVLKAFGPGTLIPRQTGFILQGTPGSKQTYRGHRPGTEADVTGNLLVGTAQAEQEFQEAGYKFYVFGHGERGMGFYKQGSRNGQSIRLKAHKAGLRLPESLAPGVKGLVLDFEGAKQQLITRINTAAASEAQAPAEHPASNGTYDLQGRRLPEGQLPKPGLYLVNGRKTLIRK